MRALLMAQPLMVNRDDPVDSSSEDVPPSRRKRRWTDEIDPREMHEMVSACIDDADATGGNDMRVLFLQTWKLCAREKGVRISWPRDAAIAALFERTQRYCSRIARAYGWYGQKEVREWLNEAVSACLENESVVISVCKDGSATAVWWFIRDFVGKRIDRELKQQKNHIPLDHTDESSLPFGEDDPVLESLIRRETEEENDSLISRFGHRLVELDPPLRRIVDKLLHGKPITEADYHLLEASAVNRRIVGLVKQYREESDDSQGGTC